MTPVWSASYGVTSLSHTCNEQAGGRPTVTWATRCWIAVMFCVLVTGCGGDDASSRPDHQPTSTTQTGVETPTSELPGYVGSPQPEPGRSAPDVTSGPLTFTQVRVFASASSGNYVVRANVMNTGAQFLNGAGIQWSILDAGGQQVDSGESTIAALAPGETTIIHLEGTVPHSERWTSAAFEFTGAD